MSSLNSLFLRFCGTLLAFAIVVPSLAHPVRLSLRADALVAPNTFTVVNINPSGEGSLRQAILNANATPGTDVINFKIDSGIQKIFVPGILPTVTDPVLIDGTTQPGFSGAPLIELDGVERNFPGLTISCGNSIVQGLVINRFAVGIRLVTGGNNIIRGNYLGTDVSGQLALGRGDGVLSESSQNIIGGTEPSARNLISGNNYSGVNFVGGQFNQVIGNFIGTNITGSGPVPNGQGIAMFGGTNNTIGGSTAGAGNIISGNGKGFNIYRVSSNHVLGNFIGTDVSGSSPIPNLDQGISIVEGSNNIIGGSTPGARNIVSGNRGPGIMIGAGSNAPASGNRIEGNYIGVNVAGAAALSNAGGGVRIGSEANNNIVGGVVPGAGNVISGNNAEGVAIQKGVDTLIQGNFIGTDATGTYAIANRAAGVHLHGASNTTIGGTTAAARNIISGNGLYGVLLIDGAGGSANQVKGNYIGTRSDGIAPLGNASHGIFITNLSKGNTIGGLEGGAGNVIAFNGGPGVGINVSDPPGNMISGNSIFGNAGLGIDWYSGGPVMENDYQDYGNNNAQNYPILTTSEVTGAGTEIFGSLNSKPNSSFSLEFFSSSACDPSGHGEGQKYLGTRTVSTDQNGDVLFDITLANIDTIGSFITVTATNTARFTSEFSACVKATEPTGPTLLTEENSIRAFAWDSVTKMRDPFPVLTRNNLSADGITRISLFVADVEPQRVAISNFTAQAEDANGIHSLPIEYVGMVPGFAGWTQIVVKLTDELRLNGDVKVAVSCRGLFSSQALLGIRAP